MEQRRLKPLITGAKGQLGTSFQKLFKSLDINFIATDINELDITNCDAVLKFIEDKDINIIINCAAYNNVDGAEDDKENCYALNSLAPYYLTKAAKSIGAIFVTYSTDFVFDGKKQEPYKEDDTPNPLSVYGASKLDGEKSVLSTYDKVFIIRTSWLFGKGNNFNTQVINWAKKNTILRIVDDQISAPTFSDDLALFSWLLIKTNAFGLYHFSNEGIASKFDQAQYVLQKMGWQGTLQRAKTGEFAIKAKRPAFSKLDSSKLARAVGKEIPTWQDGIDRWFGCSGVV